MQCGRPLLARQPFAPDAFDGYVNVIADEMNPARVAALRRGMGEAMVAYMVQINCGSGMQSIDTGYRTIREGSADLILAGGAEALSYTPLVMIFGTGYAPFRGGPLNYARARGPENVVAALHALATRFGDRFAPDAGWDNFK